MSNGKNKGRKYNKEFKRGFLMNGAGFDPSGLQDT